MQQPFVSVITPTYNRRKFLPSLIECYMSQTYLKSKMEWVILDDGTDCVKDVFEAAALKIPNIRYIRHEQKLLIGAKRNILNKESKGDIIVAMDDDDYYCPERVAHVVQKFSQSNPSIQLAGSSEIYMYYSDIKKIYKMGPFHKNHATNGTMAWKRSYADSHTYDETVTHAEEKSFLDEYKHPMIQLDPFKVMLVISHSENTFDKKKLRDGSNPFIKETSMKINSFIKSAPLRSFFSSA
uniref:Glycosyltransferase 2-like domain-containing protein n=1 Tax=viral metagenome TaxID=1070528 RepID=A0A6C0KL63_9ZZZZ